MTGEDFVGALCVGTFVDRAGRVVLQFDRTRPEGEGPTWRLVTEHREIRIDPQHIVEFGAPQSDSPEKET